MTISYEIIVTIINLIDSSTSRFSKNFSIDLADSLALYNNVHVLSPSANMLKIFADEINAYTNALHIEQSSIDIDEFEVNSLTENVDVYFEDAEDNVIPLAPVLKCYVYPKNEPLKEPKLEGIAYDSTTIIWSWPEDEEYAHYLIDEHYDNTGETPENIIAQIPAGQKTYTETGLEPDTSYTRRLVNYTAEQTSLPSSACTVQTEATEAVHSLSEYEIPRDYDFTSDDADRQIIDENLEAFHSGVGDNNDLKVYKQMDADFYQQFKAYFKITGQRTQRERRYAQIGFNYKLCLEATEEIDEQEGEVTFCIDVYPRENISINDYVWNTFPVKVKTKLNCTVWLRREDTDNESYEHWVYKPKYEEKWDEVDPPEIPYREETTQSYAAGVSIILSFDMSSSMRFNWDGTDAGNNSDRMKKIKEIGKSVIDTIDSRIDSEAGTSVTKEWIIYKWATPNALVGKTTDKSQAKGYVDSLTHYSKNSNDSYTCFNSGLNCGVTPAYNIVGQIFFTDGFCNIPDSSFDRNELCIYRNGRPGPGQNTQFAAAVLQQSISTTIRTASIFLNGVNYYDKDYDLYYSSHVGEIRLFNREIMAWTQAISTAFFPIGENEVMESLDTNRINSFVDGSIISLISSSSTSYEIDPEPRDEEHDGITWHWDGSEWSPKEPLPVGLVYRDGKWMRFAGLKFLGWERVRQDTTTFDYHIDKAKHVDIEIDFDDAIFEHGPTKKSAYNAQRGLFECITPIVYNRDERRVTIPSGSIIGYGDNRVQLTYNHGQVKTLYNLIMEKVRTTSIWNEGYQYTIGTVEDNGEQDQFLVQNLQIRNTYNWADDDININEDFGISDYEDGWNGSVNTFTDYETRLTSTKSDDEYLVLNKDSYIYIQGYIDAIIYDGNQFLTRELNAYDQQSYALISKDDYYGELCLCRKNANFSYDYIARTKGYQRTKPYHVIDLLQKDKDIYITCQQNVVDALKKEGDWVDAGQLSQDFVGHNDTMYSSPILNYRFNLEDPDAKTPICEILPECDPYSTYKHIVCLYVYYARNVYITNTSNYVAEFGDNPIAYRTDPYIVDNNNELIEGLYKWTRKEWADGVDNGWWIDNYLYFYAEKMTKQQPYFDTLPGEGMETLYGMVNNRYGSSEHNGKNDMHAQMPKFNIPTTITDKGLEDTVRIYLIITEYNPPDSLVSYRWDRTWNNIDSITDIEGNGGYVTFSSDAVTYKDVVYDDLIQTINYENLEVFDNKTTEKTFEIEKPETFKQYEHYYLEVETDNSDVIAMRYPVEMTFDDNDIAQFNASFKGVINATSQWAPRIHNGYYYLNQHEYFAYAEFDVEADFEEFVEEECKKVSGYVNVDVSLLRPAGPPEEYSITKEQRSELIQDEKHFKWVNKPDDPNDQRYGLTINPTIDGMYYKAYETQLYVSPVILFPNALTEADKLTVDYYFEDGSDYLPMEVRAYDIDNGCWGEWQPFANDSIPVKGMPDGSTVPMLSNAYQVRMYLQASTVNRDFVFEDYLCCYLDWKDDISEENCTNIETITDHMTNGPIEDVEGTFISKIIDFGCESTFSLAYFESRYNDHIKLFVAASDSRNDMLIENVVFQECTNRTNFRESVHSHEFTGRYFRYKVIIPPGEKLYWIHKKFKTKETTVMLPYIHSIHMGGTWQGEDEVDNFINVEAFEVIADGNEHIIFDRLIDLISSDVTNKGYELSEINRVKLTSTSDTISLTYNGIEFFEHELQSPTVELLGYPLIAKSAVERITSAIRSPFIFVHKDDYNNDSIVITGTPQQYCPITVEDQFGNPYMQLFDEIDIDLSRYEYNAEDYEFMRIFETFVIDETSTKFISLKRNCFEEETFELSINGVVADRSLYEIRNNLVIFHTDLAIGDTVTVTYFICNTFIADINRKDNITTLRLYSNKNDANKDITYNEKIDAPITYSEWVENNSRYSISADGQLHVNPANEESWITDSDSAVYYEELNDEPNFFLTNDPVSEYNLTVKVWSHFADFGVNGVLIAMVRDNNLTIHTLSLILNPNNTSFGIADETFDGNIMLIYDLLQPTQRIIRSMSLPIYDEVQGFDQGWADYREGMFVHVSKDEDAIQTIVDVVELEGIEHYVPAIFDLNLIDEYEIFKQATDFGLINYKQKYSYFNIQDIRRTKYNTVTKKYKVFFETDKRNNKFVADDLSLNPVYRTEYNGFIYLTDEKNEIYTVNIYCNPTELRAGGFDKVDISIELLDIHKNPVIHRYIAIDCDHGILSNVEDITDMNGVVHIVYTSAPMECYDDITFTTHKNDGTNVVRVLTIHNKAE